MISVTMQLLLLSILITGLSSERLGVQSGNQKPVPTSNGFIPAEEFHRDYIIPGIPLLFKGAAKKFEAFSKWTDDYLKELPESEHTLVQVEYGKKENRDDPSDVMSFKKFLNIYNKEDIYLVHGVPKFLARYIPVYDSINCNYFLNHLLSDMVMWFSSGGTTSVWHTDSYENINCLLRGSKELIMADKKDVKHTHIDKIGDYSSVDVDNVDIEKYPDFKKVAFYNASMEAGDCLYIPWKWHHYVKSYGSNLAINVWFESYRSPINYAKTDVKTFDQVHFKYSSVDLDEDEDNTKGDVKVSLHQAVYRAPHLYTHVTAPLAVFTESVNDVIDELELSPVSEDKIKNLFKYLDKNNDSSLDYGEIDDIRRSLDVAETLVYQKRAWAANKGLVCPSIVFFICVVFVVREIKKQMTTKSQKTD